MTDLLLSARPSPATDFRAVPMGKEADTSSLQDPAGDMPPVQAPEATERVKLQPLPLPERQTPEAPPPREEELTNLAAVKGAAGPDLASLPEIDTPARIDSMSLFQGMLVQASRSGVNVPGTSMHIYSLVKQLSILVENKSQVPA